MTNRNKQAAVLVGAILEEEVVLSLSELCRAAQLSAERVIELAHEGVVDPIGREPESWRFRGINLQRIRCAQRLHADLGVNASGIALVLDLLDEIERLRARLDRIQT